jgi:hypothetical protein
MNIFTRVILAVVVGVVSTPALAGSISGHVSTAGSGTPITDGYVAVYSSAGSYLGIASIGSGGAYSYTGLAAAAYFARTEDTGFLDELWNNLPCAQGACSITSGTPINVGAGVATADFALATGGAISGTVTGPSGQPITNGYAEFYDASGHYLGLASLDNSGMYTYSGLAAGSYFVRTTDTAYLDELWNNIPCAQGACTVTSGTPVVVAANGTATANFSLGAGGGIAGNVTVTATGQPVTRGYVVVYNSTGNYLGLTAIGNNGAYTYSGLTTGTYYARTSDTGLLDEIWNNIPGAQGACTITGGTPITVSTSLITANFSLDSGAKIIGTITASGTGLPISAGYVVVYNASGGYLGLAAIAANGTYVYSGLSSGSYFARTEDTGFIDELWNDVPCAQGACNVTGGTPIVLTTNGQAAANFALGGSDRIFLSGFEL